MIRIATSAIVAAVLMVMGIADMIGAAMFKSDISKAYDEYRNDITIMAGSEYEKGQNVYGDVLYLYGCFCEETTTRTSYGITTSSNVTGSYYLMPIVSDNEKEEKYITVLVHNKDSVSALESITDDTYAFLDGDENIEWHDYFLMGKVKPLEKDVREYMIDWFRDNEWFDSYSDSEMNKYIVPYQIEEYDPDSRSKAGGVLFGIGLAVLVIFAVIFIIMNKRFSSGSQTFEENTYTPYAPTENNVPDTAERYYNMPQYTPAQPISAVPKPPKPSASAPEEFFGSLDSRSSEKKEELQPEPKPMPKLKPVSKPKPAPKPQPAAEKEMSGLNTDDLDLDGLDDLDKPAANRQTSVISSAGDMNGVDSSGLDTDSLGSYTINNDAEESGSEYYSNDDYTFDSAPSDIKLSEMDE